MIEAIFVTNAALAALPKVLYQRIDFKTISSIVGAVLCAEIAELTGTIVNPIEKGHPDILPAKAATASEAQLRNYPVGLEIKATVGFVKIGSNLKAGKQRITALSGIAWQAHHKEIERCLGIVWDFAQPSPDGFLFPIITAAYYSKSLQQNDWGKISGTEGRNTKVCGMKIAGKRKMEAGLIAIVDDHEYMSKYKRLLGG